MHYSHHKGYGYEDASHWCCLGLQKLGINNTCILSYSKTFDINSVCQNSSN